MSSIPAEVVRRYALKKNLSLAEADVLFNELEAFLDTASLRSASPTPRVDSVWHEFILHTKIYASYCRSRYGQFVHHVPLSPLLQVGTPKDDEEKDGKRCSSGRIPTPNEDAVPLLLDKCDSAPCASDCRSSCKTEVPPLAQQESLMGEMSI